jgi:hypothetical protein
MPLALSIPVIILFERSQLGKAVHGDAEKQNAPE